MILITTNYGKRGVVPPIIAVDRTPGLTRSSVAAPSTLPVTHGHEAIGYSGFPRSVENVDRPSLGAAQPVQRNVSLSMRSLSLIRTWHDHQQSYLDIPYALGRFKLKWSVSCSGPRDDLHLDMAAYI